MSHLLEVSLKVELGLDLSDKSISVLDNLSDNRVTPAHESNLLILRELSSVLLLQEDLVAPGDSLLAQLLVLLVSWYFHLLRSIDASKSDRHNVI